MPESAAEELGLDEKTAFELFIATRWQGKRREITPTQAARVLTELAESGRVMWGPDQGRDETENAGDEDQETQTAGELPF